MSSSRVRFKKPPSKRQVMAWTAFASGDLTKMPAYKPPVKRGKQKESKVNDEIIKAARLIYRAMLLRNRRGMVRTESGGMFPYGLGRNGFPDNVGPTPITITPGMVGKTISAFTAIEAKTDTGVVDQHQIECIEELRDMGCIAGVARNSQDYERIMHEWLRRMNAPVGN